MRYARIRAKAKECYQKQIDPKTTEFESFFHYTDEKIFEVGFIKGYDLTDNNISNVLKRLLLEAYQEGFNSATESLIAANNLVKNKDLNLQQ